MPLRDPYGVWKGTLKHWHTEQARHISGGRHGYLIFWDDATPANKQLPGWTDADEAEWQQYRKDRSHRDMDYLMDFRSSAVNVQSDGSSGDDDRIVYWTGDLASQRIIDGLAGLERKQFYQISPPAGEPVMQGIDFLKEGLVDLAAGIVRERNVAGNNNDILDAWDEFWEGAIPYAQTELYLFGTLYLPKKDGIHNIHMNQGSTGRHKGENGSYQDGGVIIKNPTGQWRFFFTAFASQKAETDEDGNATTDENVAERAGDTSPHPGEGDDEDDTKLPCPKDIQVEIKAALINPVGADNTDPSNLERIQLVNLGPEAVSLAGWKFRSGNGSSKDLPAEALRGNGTAKTYDAGPECQLSNKGGRIQILDASGAVVDSVVYDKPQAQPEGQWVAFLH